MTVINQSRQNNSFLDTPIFASWTINWELVLYGIIFLLAVITRFYDLGARVMSHDESLHALFSFKLYDGDGYIHDPLMHGPLQFHLVALSYLLFGDNDFSARIPAAIFGVILVILPFSFRPWLGRIGALVTSIGLLISPSLLYYGRYIRNESLIVLFTTLLALSLFQYMRSRQSRWLYWGAAAVSLSLATKEVALIHGFIGVLFLGGAYLWERLATKRLWTVQIALLGVSIVLFIAALSYFRLGPEASRTGGILLMIFGLFVAFLSISLNIDRQTMPVSSTILSFKNPIPMLIGSVTMAAAIFVLLHTTFFTNPNGVVSGTWGAVSYWLAQQEVERGSQPGYYYLILMTLYEFLPLLIGGIGAIYYLIKSAPSHDNQRQDGLASSELTPRERRKKRRQQQLEEAEALETRDVEAQTYPSDGGTFVSYLIVWAIGSFVIYSWAGEKMPWLNTHITLPFIFLTGHVTQTVLNRFDWQIFKTQSGVVFTILLPLFGAAFLAMLSRDPFQGQELSQLTETSQFFVSVVAVLAIGAGLWTFGRRLQGKSIRNIVFIVIISLMTLFTIRFAWLSTFVNYDLANEFIVYAHGAPDVKWVLEEIDDISRRTIGDKQIKVAYGGVIWPLEWYMRDYPNRAFFGSTPNRDALDAPVVLLSPDPDVALEDVEPYLGDQYHRFTYRQVWWPVEDYKNQTLGRLWENYVVPNPEWEGGTEIVRHNREWLWNVIFYRNNINHTLSEWPFRTQMYFFVRKDIINQLWDYRTGPMSPAEIPIDPYEGMRQILLASQIWGSQGEADGQFHFPRTLTISPQGQLYVADSNNNRIQIFDQNGNLLKVWGDGEGSAPGQFKEPWGIAVSPDGRVYVADTWNHRIQIFDEEGNYISEFGTEAQTNDALTMALGSFWGPRGLTLDAAGNLYVADTGNKRIQKFSASGEFLGVWGGGGIIPGYFDEPTSIAVDAAGNFYVADNWNHRIQKFDTDFNFITEWPIIGWENREPDSKPFITVDSQNRVYVSDPKNFRVIVYNAEGELLTTFGQFGQDSESFRLPLGIAIGDNDALFVLDSNNHRVMKFILPE